MILHKNHISIELRDHLFWDVPKDSIDLDKNRRLIIQRVLSRGNKDEFGRIFLYYGQEVIRETVDELPELDARTVNYMKKLLHYNL